MEIDDKLKNRLAGTAVVTVLAVIFLPMLFDTPAEKKAQVVSELDIPHKPEVSPLLTTAIVPDKTAEVAAKPKPVTTTPDTVAPAENLADNTEADAESENPAQDSESVAQEDEKPVSVKKKKSKKKANEDVVVAAADEEKPEKTVKKSSKADLPVLDEDNQDKKKANKSSLPDLDSAPKAEKRRWVVQVASLSDQTKANEFRDKLRSQGFPATVDSAWIKGKGRVYRLKVGPELDAEKAQAMKAKINQLNSVNSIAIAE